MATETVFRCRMCGQRKSAEHFETPGIGRGVGKCAGCRELGRLPVVDLFWLKVDKRGPRHPRLRSRCWVWRGGMYRTGYGSFCWGKVRKATHVAFFLANGHWPEPCCLHKCDNPICVNPKHLEAGTHKQNMSDMSERGRAGSNGLRGEDVSQAKLNEKQVVEILRSHSEGKTLASLGREFGVTIHAIYLIVHRKNWRHVTGHEAPREQS